MDPGLPTLVLVGRPNVGKSTLFNRLTGTRDALVADIPGLTRDRQYGFGTHGERRFIVVDTGGLLPAPGDPMARLAEEQAQMALSEASAILFLADARAGLTPADETIAAGLRKKNRPVRVVVNKAEGLGAEAAAEFFKLGLGEPTLVSAAHGQGIQRLLDEVLAPYPAAAADTPVDGIARVAVVGRPNVGKSTLVNRLIGEERMLTADQPGTTRDAVSVPFHWGERDYVLVDTAGIRRRARVDELVEKLSVVKALQAIDQADVVIVVVDAKADIGEQDARLLGLVTERGRGLVLAVNKWDGLDDYARERVKQQVDYRLPFLDFMPLHYISARHGSGLGELMQDVDTIYDASRRELPTPQLTKALEQAVFDHQPPAVIGRRIKLRYAHLGGRNPPVIVVHGNQTDKLPDSYKRYLANQFREKFKLKGLPLRIEFRTGENPFKGKKNELTTRQRRKRSRARERFR